MLYSKFISCNCDVSKFWCWVGEEFSVLSKRAVEVIIPFSKYLYARGRVLLNETIKQNIDLDWFPKMTWEYLFQPLVPENKMCMHRKQARKTHWVTDWFEIVCHFSEKEKFKHGCVFLLPNVSLLDSVNSVICRLVWNCFRSFKNLSEPLKSIHACL